MIEFKNWTITGDGLLARQYDNLSRRVEVVGDLPDGWEWELLVQVGDAMDIIRLSPMEGGVGHTLTAEQVSIPGYYTAQLRGRQGEVVRHTNTVQCFVSKSLSGDAKWPELPSEFSQAEERIAELNAHPPKPGTNGFWMLWDADRDAYITSSIPLPEGGGGGSAEGAVRYDTEQRLESWQTSRARENINAAPKILMVQLYEDDGKHKIDLSLGEIMMQIADGGMVIMLTDLLKTGKTFPILLPSAVYYDFDPETADETNAITFSGYAGGRGVNVEVVSNDDVRISYFALEGPQGEPGADGHTPVKGKDYWTQEDRQSMVNDVLAALPAAEGVGF